MERIGIIGLGRMGSAIAQRLTRQGQSVTGWTRSGRTVESIPAARDLIGLVKSADTLLLSLFDDAAVAEVLDALLECDLCDKLIVDTSTITPATLTARQPMLQAKGAALVDAPIAGGPELVLAGACGIFIGGPDRNVARAQALLTHITERNVHIGPLGTGLAMKSVNNALAQTYFAGLVEQARVAKRAGVPLDMALRLLANGPVAAPIFVDRVPRILGQDDTVGFTVEGILKDNLVFQNIAADFGVDTPTLQAAEAMERLGIEHGLAEADPAALVAHAYHTA